MIRGELPPETMSRISGNKIWRTVCNNRSGYLVRSCEMQKAGGETAPASYPAFPCCLTRASGSRPHRGNSVSAQPDYARQLAAFFGFVDFTGPRQNKLKIILLSGLGYKKHREIRK